MKVTIYPVKEIELASTLDTRRSFSIFDVFRKTVKPVFAGKYHIGHIRSKMPYIAPHQFYASPEYYEKVEKYVQKNK